MIISYIIAENYSRNVINIGPDSRSRFEQNRRLSKNKEIVFSSVNLLSWLLEFWYTLLRIMLFIVTSFDYSDLSLEKTISLFLLKSWFCSKCGRASSPLGTGRFLSVWGGGLEENCRRLY